MKNKVFLLITNTSNETYWSYVATPENVAGDLNLSRMLQKYGRIYVNSCGGWFHHVCIKQIHDVQVGTCFPV